MGFFGQRFEPTNSIIRTCMNESMYNANTCIGYKLDFYRYTFHLNMYIYINNAYTVIMSKSLSDEQTVIVHILKHCFLLDLVKRDWMNSH